MMQQQAKGANFGSVGSNSSGGVGWIGVQNKLSDCFEAFIAEFQTQIDFYFKTYNQNLRESSIDLQLKSTKKERIRYLTFLVHEEKEYWKEFPRKLEFYNDYLRQMQELFCEKETASSGSKVSLIITNILNILPIASKKYCFRFGIDAVFHQDLDNKITFDTITQQQHMFDADDDKNWRLLGFTITIFASDLISILLEHQTQRDVQISPGVVDLLLEICQYYCRVQLFTSEDIDEESIFDIYYKQIQVAWAKIYGQLSKINFDKCLKFMMTAIQQDFRKMSEEETQVMAHRIYFCRFLQINPAEILMASNVLSLMDSICNLLTQKHILAQMKNVLLMTLKFLVEQLQFYSDNPSQKDPMIDSPVSVLWPVVETLFQITEKCRKKELLKDYAIQLQILIIKVSPNSFFNEKMGILLKSQKIQSYFEAKKTYNHGLQLIMELSCLRATPFNKYQDWNPTTKPRSYLLLEDKTNDLYSPIKEYRSHQTFKLMRRMYPSEQIPITFKDSFKLVFNPRIIPENLTAWHLQYLKQMAFEDIEFTSTIGLPHLLSFLRTQERYDIPILGLKLIDYMLNPLYEFKNEYLLLWPKSQLFLENQLKSLHSYASLAIKEIWRSPLLKSDFIVDLNNFFKSDDSELCNDQMSIIWTSQHNQDEEPTFKRSTNISQHLKNKGLGKFYLQEEKRVISFEEFKEIQTMSSDLSAKEYQNDQLNSVAKGIQGDLRQWDFKKEQFIRHRLACYLAEDRKEGQRQNTSHFGMIASKKEEQQLLRQIIKMMHYLPDVHYYLKFMPIHKLIIEEQAFLTTNKVSEMAFSEFPDEKVIHLYPTAFQIQQQNAAYGELSGGFGNQSASSVLVKRRKSGGTLKSPHNNPKLRECQNLLPYMLLSADYKIVAETIKELQRLIVFGDFKTKVALMDQMIYFLKELMLESPMEFLVVQIMQQIIKMIKVWHTSEKNKLKLSEKILDLRQVEGLEIIYLNQTESGTQDLKKKKSNNNISKRMLDYQYLFETLDMVSLLGINHKDRLIRQLSIILLAENGKLKRLLIPKESYSRGLYDIIYYESDDIQKFITQRIAILDYFKTKEFRNYDDINAIVSELSPYQLIVDNFVYKKSGVTESMVRDIQILWIGEIFLKWKSILLSSTPKSVSTSILNFINTLSQRTLQLFEAKNESDLAMSKDYVGLNLLMAIVMYNVTHSHLNAHILSSQQRVQSDGSDPCAQPDEYSSQQSVPQVLSTNSVFEDYQNLVTLLDLDITDIYRAQFGKFYPQRFSVSTVIIAFLYQLQIPYHSKSIENLKDIFRLVKTKSSKESANPFHKNCLLFYTLLSLDANDRFMTYIRKDKNQLVDFCKMLKHHFVFNNDDQLLAQNLELRKQRVVLLINYLHAIVTALKSVYSKDQYNEIKRIFPPKLQYSLLMMMKDEHQMIESQSPELSWLLPKIKTIWNTILSFELIFGSIPNIRLDLKFLVQLEQDGYKVLKYYRYLHNNNPNAAAATNKESSPQALINKRNLQEEVQQEFTVNELKYLLNHIYTFYNSRNHPNAMLMNKNTYYKCFIKYIVGCEILFGFLLQKNFNQVYGQLTASCLRSTKALIEAKIKLFISYGLHSKYFVVGLFMSLNATEPNVIQSSKILCLSILPLMFEDEQFREAVENKINSYPDLNSLVAPDNKEFFRFLKQVSKDEEQFNMHHHFEKYFSLSGLLRSVLNEIIKLQGLTFSQRMLLRVLDILSYFLSGVQLRRSPLTQENAFIFDNMIDYKSFELLSKLYKISDKLVDCDEEGLIMQLWQRLVENRPANFEILAKFLVHSLSSCAMKLKGTDQYSLEFEKHKRYALSIFNYLKARAQQLLAGADVRNSMVVSGGACWSHKMIQLISKAALNLQSKYVLEKVKLKKLLQLLHSEVNECGIRLQLRGGLHNDSDVLLADNTRRSLSMAELLQSQRFLEAFSARNRREKTIMKNLLFRVRRIMTCKFSEIAGNNSKKQMPDMIIKYLENSLVFITNDIERPSQVINFTLKEELTVVVSMLVLTVSLIQNPSVAENENRFYFLLQTFNKLALNVPSVNKYFNFKNFNSALLLSREGTQNVTSKLYQVFNMKASFEHFALYTKVHFKMLFNLHSSPVIQYHLIKLWLQMFSKHREQISALNGNQVSASQASVSEILQLKASEALTYSRNLILTLLQNAFFNILEISQTTKEADSTQIKYSIYNFKQHLTCMLDYVVPSQGRSSIRAPADPESIHVAFATNAIFWVAFSCLECAYHMRQCNTETQVQEQNNQILNDDVSSELQSIGMAAISRVLEKSDFLKMLIGVTKLSPNFYAYGVTLSKKQSSLLKFIFDALENSNSLEDAFKSLIITIRVQDYQLLNADQMSEQSEIELQRLLCLIPYIMQQFALIQKQQSNSSTSNKDRRQPIFGSYRTIVLLLKKSLSSIGIDKKKDIFEMLDIIQKEAESGQTLQDFAGLVSATVSLCNQLCYQQVIFKCYQTFHLIRDEILNNSSSLSVIDHEKMDLILETMKSFMEANLLTEQTLLPQEKIISIYDNPGELLGEELQAIKKEMRPLYFGVKNIILKEIESIDKEIDIQKFFFDQSAILESQDSALSLPKRVLTLSSAQPHILGNTSGVSPHSKDTPTTEFINNQASISQPMEITEADFSQVVKKMTTFNKRGQETASKYQNAKPAGGYNTPSDKKITELLGIPTLATVGAFNQQQKSHILMHSATVLEDPLMHHHSVLSGISSKNSRPLASKYQNANQYRQQEFLVSNSNNPTMMFEDEDIHMPVQKQLSVNNKQMALASGDAYSQKEETPAEEDYPFVPTLNSEYFQDSYQQQEPEQFEVIQEDNQYQTSDQMQNQQYQQSTFKQHSRQQEMQQPKSRSPVPRSRVYQMHENPMNNQNNEEQVRSVMSLEERVQQNNNIVYQGEMGGIVTFSRPGKSFATNASEMPPNYFPKDIVTNQIPQSQTAKNFYQPQASHEILMNPNYVAERTSKIFSELNEEPNHYQPAPLYTQQNFYREQLSTLFSEEKPQKSFIQQKDKQPIKLQKPSQLSKDHPLAKYPWLQESLQEQFPQMQQKTTVNQARSTQNDNQVTSRKVNYFETSKHSEDLPTPKKQQYNEPSKFETQIRQMLQDSEQMHQFEQFLDTRGYDVDMLHFHIKVLQLKSEQNPQKAFLMAGIIIDTYLAESAENYIASLDSKLIYQAINQYEKLSQSGSNMQRAFDRSLFDQCTQEIEQALERELEEFNMNMDL